ncbi:MAG: AmmeMemoRadiSam system protein B [Bacteroidales bacterium]|nr:AmmeMemoRadiSam system protein B [Bacteroidales bacterium]
MPYLRHYSYIENKNMHLPTKSLIVILLSLQLTFICTTCRSQNKETCVNRQSVVAGRFYSSNGDELRNDLKSLFSQSKQKHASNAPLAIISPHAGYVFSGQVAASAFNQVAHNKTYENIFVLASSHHIYMDGASIYNVGNYQTPLGLIKVNTQLANDLISKHKEFEFKADAHSKEHSLEVQLPFLQYKMKTDFQIVPIVIGTQNKNICRKIANALKPYFNEKNLFVISTDLSHYPKYEDAVVVDKNITDAICTNSSEAFLGAIQENNKQKIQGLATSICGWTSTLTLLYLTENNPGIKYQLIDYKNSGDSPYGEKDRVVGYAAISISKQAEQSSSFKLTDDEQKQLLAIARNTLLRKIAKQEIPPVDVNTLPEILKAQTGAFVTLHKHEKLRGCIGNFSPSTPLYQVVEEMAIAAALNDHRFTPVTADEINELEIEISVLTPMKKVNNEEDIVLGKHGIYIQKGNRGGTFLPQVATETGWNKEQFLGYCSMQKAGLGWDGWKEADLYTYEAIVFNESALHQAQKNK